MASLEEVLASLQLDKYIESFKKNEVDLDAAKLLNEKEFEELGLGLGPRKKLYAYFHPPAGAVAPAAAASVNLIKPAAAVAAVPAAAATAKAAPKQVLSNCGKITNIMAWDWCFDSSKWSEQGAYCENRFRLAAGDEPTQILFAGNVRRGETPFRVYNIDTGTLDYDYKPSKIDEGWSDADWSGNTIVCCGSASSGIDGTLAVFDIASKKEKGVFVGKNEMSMSDVAIVTSASGAMQAVALGQGNGQAYPPMRLFDIATLTRAGKFADVYDSPPSAVQADLNNPGCFLAASHYKFWYIDARAGKAVKRFGGGAGTIHFPVNPGGVFVASDRNTNQATQVWDIGTQKVLHTLQTAQQKNFTTSCMFSNVAVTFGPQYTGSSGGQWGFSFFDLADGGKCVHELGASVYSKRQLAMSARVIVGMSESGEFTSLVRPA